VSVCVCMCVCVICEPFCMAVHASQRFAARSALKQLVLQGCVRKLLWMLSSPGRACKYVSTF